MAVTLNGVNAARVAAVPSQNAAPGEQSGSPRTMYDEVVLLADYGANDVFVMGTKIPAGSRIIRMLFASPDMGGAATVAIGTSAATSSLAAAIDNSGQAVIAGPDAGAADMFKKLTVDTQYQLKVSGVSSGGTGNKMSLLIEYVQY